MKLIKMKIRKQTEQYQTELHPSVQYSPPENYKYQHNRQPMIVSQSDFFCLGVCIYVMVYHSFPFEGATNEEILKNKLYLEPSYEEESHFEPMHVIWANRLIYRLLDKCPFNRPSVQEIHKLLKIDFSQLYKPIAFSEQSDEEVILNSEEQETV